MALPIRLDHARPELARITVVDWTLGNACNYACSYCPPRLHDGSMPWPALAALTGFIDRLADHYGALGRALLFQFTGGEPTVYPEFLELLRHLRERRCKAGVISNGSRTLRWWREARELLDQAVLTHHVEFVDLEHFIAVTRFLAESIRTHVNVTMHPGRFDECLGAAGRIAAECADVTLTLKPLLVDFGATTYAYTAAQREAIGKNVFTIRRTRPIDESRGMMRVTFDDGSSELVKAAQLIVNGKNGFRDWQCHAGVELLAVDSGGNVYRGLCRQGGRIGHIADHELRLPTEPVVCTRATCHCATDLMTTRAAPKAGQPSSFLVG